MWKLHSQIQYFLNTFWNNIFSKNSFYYIGDDGHYLLSEHVFLWVYVCIYRVINYGCGNFIVKSNTFLGFNYWVEYVAYLILWKFSVDKGSVLGVDFEGIISCLPTGFTLFLVISNFHTSLYIPEIHKLEFHTTHVQILGTNHCGDSRWTAIKLRK